MSSDTWSKARITSYIRWASSWFPGTFSKRDSMNVKTVILTCPNDGHCHFIYTSTLSDLRRLLASVFRDSESIVLIDYFQKGHILKWENYAKLLRQLGKPIKTKHPAKLNIFIYFIRTMFRHTKLWFSWLLYVTMDVLCLITISILLGWLSSVPQHDKYLAWNLCSSDADVVSAIDNVFGQYESFGNGADYCNHEK